MATIKKPVKKMQSGGKATADSTKFYQDKLKGLSTTSPRWSAAANIINSNKKDENFAERQKTKYDLLRQYRKGKSGFDANGNPLKKQKMGGAVKKMQKGGKVTKTEYTSEQNAKDWAKKEREMTGPNAPKISSKENNENWAKRERIETMKKNVKNALKPLKKGGAVKKAKSGGSFPDLNKDGKITKADILKGRGVIAKKGAKLKKQAAVAIAMKKVGKAPKKMQYGGEAASMVPPMMKKGGKMKKAQLGGLLDKVVGGLGKSAGGFAKIKDMFGNSGFGNAGLGMINSLRKKKQASEQAPGMKKGGKVAKKTMKSGGKMKKCAYGCK